MHRRHYYYDYYRRRRYRARERHNYGPGRRKGLFPSKGAIVVLMALAALAVLASLT